MKNHLPTLTAAAVAALFSLTASAGEKEIHAKQVPQVVHEAFQKAHPAAKDAKYYEEAKNGQTAYEIEYREGGKKFEASYGTDGAPIKTEQAIKTTELPQKVLDTVKKDHPKAMLKEAEKVVKANGVESYEVGIVDGKSRLELELDPEGTLLGTEPGK